MTLSLLFVFPPTPLKKEKPIFIECPQSPEKMIELGVRRLFPSWQSHRVTLVKSLLSPNLSSLTAVVRTLGSIPCHSTVQWLQNTRDPILKGSPLGIFVPCCHLSSMVLQRC